MADKARMQARMSQRQANPSGYLYSTRRPPDPINTQRADQIAKAHLAAAEAPSKTTLCGKPTLRSQRADRTKAFVRAMAESRQAVE